jgi:hypothetical protein
VIFAMRRLHMTEFWLKNKSGRCECWHASAATHRVKQFSTQRTFMLERGVVGRPRPMERGRGPVEVMLVGGDVRQLHRGPLNLGFRVRDRALEGRGSGIIASDSGKPRAFSVKSRFWAQTFTNFFFAFRIQILYINIFLWRPNFFLDLGLD